MRVPANGIEIEVDDRGPPGGEPLLLIMGLGMQLVAWPDELVGLLVARGFRVIRFDNRDAGLSSGFDHAGVPHVAWAGIRHYLHLPVAAPYTVADMAADTAGVLDALGIARAHICGASMGGMIAQHLAASRPDRVASLTLMMTTTGARHLPQPGWRVRQALLQRPRSERPEDIVEHLVGVLRVIGSPGYPPDPTELRRRIGAAVSRAWRPAGTMRQLVAIVADGDRSAMVRRIAAPVAVVHGQDDPLIPVAAAHDLARCLPRAQCDIVPGLGHDLPSELLGRFARTIADVVAASRASA